MAQQRRRDRLDGVDLVGLRRTYGADKTTLFNDMLGGDIPYINGDESPELYPESGSADVVPAGRLTIERRNAMIAHGVSQHQNNLAGGSALAFMHKAKDAGFRVNLAYIGIDTPELSRARID